MSARDAKFVGKNPFSRSEEKTWRSVDVRLFSDVFLVTQVMGLIMLMMIIIWPMRYCEGHTLISKVGKEYLGLYLLIIMSTVYFVTNSALAYRVHRTIRRKTLKTFHGALHLAIIAMTTTGVLALLKFQKPAKPTCSSVFTWLVFVSIIMYTRQTLYSLFISVGVRYRFSSQSLHLHTVVLQALSFGGPLEIVQAIDGVFKVLPDQPIASVAGVYYLLSQTYILELILYVFMLLVLMLTYLMIKIKRCPFPKENETLKYYSNVCLA
ncbi:hypothetical protein J6590_072975 [Homalodisca vitripennis]|nr:hypothetical protein J6590_072975 [Homalodisca vitripennis]